MSSIKRACAQSGKTFLITDEDQAFYQKIGVPLPRLCPTERLRRRLSWRNEWNFHKRNCDRCKKVVISVYNEDVPNVYCSKCWWSDEWDPMQYGQTYAPDRSFFEQWRELWEKVPKLALMNDDGVNSTNCEYTTDFAYGKNVYMVAEAWYDEDCLYGTQMNYCKSSMDSSFTFKSELVYDAVACQQCYGCQSCTDCQQCTGCIFGYDLRNCSDCLLCVGLRNKQYYIWNKPYSKEEYFKFKEAIQLGTSAKRKDLQKKFEEFVLDFPHKYANLTQCENSSGHNLVNCKNAKNCFNFYQIQDGAFLVSGDGAKDCYDLYCVGRVQLSYEGLTPDDSYLARFCINTWKCNSVDYCDNSHSSNNLFGCVGLRRKQFCILNKAMTSEEYEATKNQIVKNMEERGEWGEFFPANLSPFPYSETVAADYFTPGKSPVNTPISDSNQPICEICTKPYQILKQELEFYRSNDIPLPSSCAICRNRARNRRLNPGELCERSCSKCGINLKSPYAPGRPEKIVCEACYLKLVY